jgi:hypothetical protein
MQYWIKCAGTAEDPLPANWYSSHRQFQEQFGQGSMFPRRPRVGVGDRLVLYAVGSAAQFKSGRIYAVLGVTSEPEPSPHDRWPWQVQTEMLIPGPRLPSCPSIEDIDVVSRSLSRHSHIALTYDQGKEAEQLIARAAARAGRAGACYNGPPPPEGFRMSA